MEVEEENNPQKNLVNPNLLMRLNFNDAKPSLLERMTLSDEGNEQLQKTISQEETVTTSIPWMKNPSTSWTTTSKILGVRRSPNLKPYATSSLFSTSTHPGC